MPEMSLVRRELYGAARTRPALDCRPPAYRERPGSEPCGPSRPHDTRLWMNPLDDHQANPAASEPKHLRLAALRERSHSRRCHYNAHNRVAIGLRTNCRGRPSKRKAHGHASVFQLAPATRWPALRCSGQP
jgi:hypothetical protein